MTGRTLHLGNCVVDLDRGEVRRPDRIERMSRLEVALLAYLHQRSDTAVPRDELLTEVHGYSSSSLSRAVDHAVRRLRQKIEVDPAHPEHLVTEHGFGYRLRTRAFQPPEPPAEEPTSVVRLGDVQLLLDAAQVRRDGQILRLTGLEVDLLRHLLARRGRTVPRDELLRAVWHRKGTARGLDTALYRLRCKIEVDPSQPAWLITVPRRGVMLRAAPASPPDGDVVLLFASIDDQDRLWTVNPEEMARAAQAVRAEVQHQALLSGGYPMAETAGIYCVAFAQPDAALDTAVGVHRAVPAIPVKTAIHRGAAQRQPGAFAHKTAYVGPAVVHTARLLLAAPGGRIWMTAAALAGVDPAALPSPPEPVPPLPGLFGDPADVTLWALTVRA